MPLRGWGSPSRRNNDRRDEHHPINALHHAEDQTNGTALPPANEPTPAYYAPPTGNPQARWGLRYGPTGPLLPSSTAHDIGRVGSQLQRETIDSLGDGRLPYFEAALARAKSGGSNPPNLKQTKITNLEPPSVGSTASSSPSLPPYPSGVDMNHPGLMFHTEMRVDRQYNGHTSAYADDPTKHMGNLLSEGATFYDENEYSTYAEGYGRINAASAGASRSDRDFKGKTRRFVFAEVC